MENNLKTVYIEGDNLAFKAFIDKHYFAKPRTADLVGIEGKNRWVITLEDGTKFIARPQDAK